MKKILFGTVVAIALLTGWNEEKKEEVTKTETVVEDVKKDQVAPVENENVPVTEEKEVVNEDKATVEEEKVVSEDDKPEEKDEEKSEEKPEESK